MNNNNHSLLVLLMSWSYRPHLYWATMRWCTNNNINNFICLRFLFLYYHHLLTSLLSLFFLFMHICLFATIGYACFICLFFFFFFFFVFFLFFFFSPSFSLFSISLLCDDVMWTTMTMHTENSKCWCEFLPVSTKRLSES